MDKQSEFLSFPTIYCGKTRVDNHLIIFLNNVLMSCFYRLIVIVTFQHVNRTFNVIFDFFKSHCLTNACINRMCRSITIFHLLSFTSIFQSATQLNGNSFVICWSYLLNTLVLELLTLHFFHLRRKIYLSKLPSAAFGELICDPTFCLFCLPMFHGSLQR